MLQHKHHTTSVTYNPRLHPQQQHSKTTLDNQPAAMSDTNHLLWQWTESCLTLMHALDSEPSPTVASELQQWTFDFMKVSVRNSFYFLMTLF